MPFAPLSPSPPMTDGLAAQRPPWALSPRGWNAAHRMRSRITRREQAVRAAIEAGRAGYWENLLAAQARRQLKHLLRRLRP